MTKGHRIGQDRGIALPDDLRFVFKQADVVDTYEFILYFL